MSLFLNKNIKHMQKNCIHDYHVVNERWNGYGDNKYDLYCPICDKLRKRVSKNDTNTIIKTQKVREEYRRDKY